jgi:myo-inositol-1(or 4)-monophosphatase
MNNQNKQFLDFMLKTAKQAGDLVMKHYENITVNFKGDDKNNLVTQADLESEKLIREAISKRYPTHTILGEEFGQTDIESEFLWIIDPVDGTNNIAHGHPYFAVNIGLVHKNEIIAGVTHAPKLEETFSVTKGGGAFLNGKQIHVSSTEKLSESLLGTGFPYDRKGELYKKALDQYHNAMQTSHGVRRMGAAAIDMAYLACGRLDGFFEYTLNAWDITPGILLIQEAGGQVTNMDGSKIDLYAENLIASNGVIHEEIKDKVINTHP